MWPAEWYFLLTVPCALFWSASSQQSTNCCCGSNNNNRNSGQTALAAFTLSWLLDLVQCGCAGKWWKFVPLCQSLFLIVNESTMILMVSHVWITTNKEDVLSPWWRSWWKVTRKLWLRVMTRFELHFPYIPNSASHHVCVSVNHFLSACHRFL